MTIHIGITGTRNGCNPGQLRDLFDVLLEYRGRHLIDFHFGDCVGVDYPSGPESDNPRSGTWATYRMAVKAGVETVVIEP